MAVLANNFGVLLSIGVGLLGLLISVVLFIKETFFEEKKEVVKAKSKNKKKSKERKTEALKTKTVVQDPTKSVFGRRFMDDDYNGSETFLKLIKSDTKGEWEKNLTAQRIDHDIDLPRGYGKKSIDERWNLVLNKNKKLDEYTKKLEQKKLNDPAMAGSQDHVVDPKTELYDEITEKRCQIFKDNVENFIGSVKVPLGVAGPLRVNGTHAKGDYFIPLATTEAALVASINRGINVFNQGGGIRAVVLSEGLSRDPCIICKTLIDVGKYLAWAADQEAEFIKIASQTTRHGKLIKIRYTIEGNNIHMKCMYTSGDASGQNMVTIATEAIIAYVNENCPVDIERIYIEAGMSGDKKASQNILAGCRGKRVIAEAVIKRHVFETTLHISPEDLVNSQSTGLNGLNLNGTMAKSLHFANPITAMAIALGQDPACAAEMHVGICRVNLTSEGDLYIACTLPNMLVATVGGGTKLPSQRACLELMGLYGSGNGNKLAEVMAGVCMAAELSLGAAIVSGDFAKAHKILARDTSEPIDLNKDTLEEAFIKVAVHYF